MIALLSTNFLERVVGETNQDIKHIWASKGHLHPKENRGGTSDDMERM